MRVDVKKIIAAGSVEQQKPFFDACQRVGVVELTSTKSLAFSKDSDWDAAVKALKGLSKRSLLPAVAKAELEESGFSDTENMYRFAHDVCDLLDKETELAAKYREGQKKLNYQSVFGEFNLERLRSIFSNTSRQTHFVYGSARETAVIEGSLDPGQSLLPINEIDGTLYALLISPLSQIDGDPTLENTKTFVLPKKLDYFDLVQDSGQLRQELSVISDEIETVDQALNACDAKLQALKESVLNCYNLKLRNQSMSHCNDLLPGSFFVSGYVSESDIALLQELADSYNIYLEEVAIDAKETLPTHLVNEGMSRVGQDLVEVYDTPSSEDKDPSLWVLCAFSLFFAMIIGDGGYGAIFLLGALIVRFKVSKQAPQATAENNGALLRFSKLFGLLAVTTLLWGTVTHSFFGISLGYEHPLRTVSFVHHLSLKKLAYHLHEGDSVAQNFQALLPSIEGKSSLEAAKLLMQQGKDVLGEMADSILKELSILIGLVHLSLSMLRCVRKNWANFAWILFMLGGYLYVPTFLNATISAHFLWGMTPLLCAQIGLVLLYGGLALSVCLAVLQHGWIGLLEIMQVIQVFSDLLSYLRLYALALAGAMLSATFNSFALTLPYGLGIFATILGHIINIVLGIMGGVIHGLRLNFLEWYHYSFDGGGRALRPLKKVSPNSSINFNNS